MDLAQVMKALAHENRLRILNLLYRQSLCVCELKNIMGINQSNASRHLRKLAKANIINQSRDGRWIYYSIDQNIYSKYSFLKLLFNDFSNEKALEFDLENLKTYQESDLECSQLEEAEIFN